MKLKRIITTFLFVMLACCTQVFALEPQDLTFTPVGRGKYIYANNPEAIRNIDLSDTSSANPVLLMSNGDMEADRYSMFVSYINRTEVRDDNYAITIPGFDIEVDVQFIAKEDMSIHFSALSFEVPETKASYIDNRLNVYEDTQVCLNAWSSYLNAPIYIVGGGMSYSPKAFTPTTVYLKKGDVLWLSQLIENYRTLPCLKVLHMLSDFQTTGVADINIAALTHNGALKDRRHHSPYAWSAPYVRDKQYKGVADTLPAVTTNLSYRIDDTTAAGTHLPVTVYNQFNPEGNTTERWITHINPQEDMWSKNICAESDMLKFSYYDPQKLTYYGSNVTEKSPVWEFDVYHSDTNSYYSSYPYTAENYIPNYPLDTQSTHYGNACNLGNYGVTLYYNLSIQNDGTKTRYFYYNLNTATNCLAAIEGQPFYSCKRARHEKANETMVCMPLPPGETTDFTLKVVLPTNCYGGMENSFVIADREANIALWDEAVTPLPGYYATTGRHTLKWDNGNLYLSSDGTIWTEQPLSADVRRLFENGLQNCQFADTGSGYMMRWKEYDGVPAYYQSMTNRLYNTVYFLDYQFNLVAQKAFDQLPYQMSGGNGVCYVKAGDRYYYTLDMKNWEVLSTNSLPISNYGPFVCRAEDVVQVSKDGVTFRPVTFLNQAPREITASGGLYRSGDLTSPDGVYWLPAGREAQAAPIYVLLDGRYLGFDTYPVLESDRTLVPLRLLLEQLGCGVTWDNDTQTATVTKGADTVQLTIDRPEALVNGRPVPLDAPPRLQDDRTLIPLRFVSEQFHCTVEWDEAADTAIITSPGSKSAGVK